MRNIKFRMFDNEDKTFIYFTLKECITKEVELFVDADIDEGIGLVDKNGKDIYEGDILYMEEINEKFIVLYYSPEASFYYKDEHGNLNNFLSSTQSEIEIIGNLYETN